ncbi:MAG: dienelactone hydrolase family protein [Clostridiales Family XIII bacterium]|jgi:dienelactone hydrolase|nr:dienelactone hydrolase family protein [Clostridiales Family XIII bacterium]
MTFAAAALGLVGIFVWFGLGLLAVQALVVAGIIVVFHLAVRAIGYGASRKIQVQQWLKKFCSVLLCVLTLLISVSGLIYAVQDDMFFYNVKDEESREILLGEPGYSEVAFTAENGKTYHGMLYRGMDETAPLLIYFGGNGEVSYRNMRNRLEQNQWQYFSGYSYLYVDYEGYGLNDGSANYMNMYEEALAIFDYAVTLPAVDTERIVVMGYSLGTGCAVYLAAHRPVAGLILAAPYANGFDMYNNMLPIFHSPLKLLIKQKFPSDEYAPDVTCPVLVFASHADEAIPFASSERLSAIFSGDTELVELDSVLHDHIFSADGVFEKVQSFLEEIKAE